jgi:orotate phosphoribosyltransferase
MRLAQPQTSAERLVHFALGIGALELVPELRELRSGRMSPYFFNSGLFNSGKSLETLSSAFASVMIDRFRGQFDTVFGPPYKGITIAAAAAMKYSVLTGQDVGYSFSRKEPKTHGEGGLIVGMPLEGKRVLIVDDVITDGASKREAVEIVKAHGGTPMACLIAFNRKEKGYDSVNQVDLPTSAAEDFETMFGIPLVAASALPDLVSLLSRTIENRANGHPLTVGATDEVDEMYAKIRAYRIQYGIG